MVARSPYPQRPEVFFAYLFKFQGFTLVELLASIGIVTVLMSLTAAGIHQYLEVAKAGKCMNNLQQIASAFHGYLSDHNMVMPQRFYQVPVQYGYDELLMPYAGNDPKLFICPSQTKTNLTNLSTNHYGEPGYGMNWYYDNMPVSKVDWMSQTIMVAETQGGGKSGSHRADRDSVFPGELANQRHLGKANYLFFDGHVERLKHKDTLHPKDLWGTNFGEHNVVVAPGFEVHSDN